MKHQFENVHPEKAHSHPDVAISEHPWGLFLKSLDLQKHFGRGLEREFHSRKNIYFLAIVWDYSGQIPFLYPPKGFDNQNLVVKLKPGSPDGSILGDGIQLRPIEPVYGALRIALLVFESKEGERKAGEVGAQIHDAINSSDIAKVFEKVSNKLTSAETAMIDKAAGQVTTLISTAMEKAHDRHVATFHGSYAVGVAQPGTQTYENNGVKIAIDLIKSDLNNVTH